MKLRLRRARWKTHVIGDVKYFKAMKIVHICTSLEGGAGLAAARIIRSTRALDVDARVLVAQGKRSEYVDVVEPVMPWSNFWLIKKIQILLKIKGMWPKSVKIHKRINDEADKNHSTVTFTSPITQYKNITDHPWVKEADIVHLHWIGNFVDYESFFGKVEKSIVWTIHDENPGMGGFHYKMWYDHASDSFKTLDDKLALLKRRVYGRVKSMTLVAISTMMMDFFHKNPLLCNFPCIVIHNGLEEACFRPISKTLAREALGLPEESNVFLFVALNIYEDRKGLKELIEALERLDYPNTILVCLGNYQVVPSASFEIRCEGFVGNNRLQSLYYSAADYFVMPSYQESFGQTITEAMSCGTPVVSFPTGVSDDLINKGNGVICDNFTVAALVKGIKIAMSRSYDRQQIREDVVRRFSYNVIGQQYVDLYHQILANKNKK